MKAQGGIGRHGEPDPYLAGALGESENRHEQSRWQFLSAPKGNRCANQRVSRYSCNDVFAEGNPCPHSVKHCLRAEEVCVSEFIRFRMQMPGQANEGKT